MRVAHIVPNVEGGLLNYVEDLLSDLGRAGGLEHCVIQNDLSSVNTGEKPVVEQCIYLGLTTYRIKNLRLDLRDPVLSCHDSQTADVFEALLSAISPDIVHFHSFYGLPYSLCHIAYLRGHKTVVTYHDPSGICYRYNQFVTDDGRECVGPLNGFNCVECSKNYSQSDLAARYNYVVNVLNHYADKVTTVSEYVKGVYRLNGIEKDIQVIRTGTSLPIKEDRKAIRDGRINVLYVGGVGYRKGLVVLLEALNGLDNSKYVLNVYGNGTTGIFKETLVATYPGLNVRYQGKYFRGEIVRILDEHDLVVLPSIGSEPAPLVQQEALARRVPCIVSSAGGMKEYVEPGWTGMVFRKGDSCELGRVLAELFDEPEKIQRLSDHIVAKNVRKFCETTVEYIKLYRDILSVDRVFAIERIAPSYYNRSSMASLDISLEGVVGEVVAKLNSSVGGLTDVYIFGTGNLSSLVLRYIDLDKFNIKGFFDNDEQKHGLFLNGIKVTEPGYVENARVIIASSWASQISKQLIELGYGEESVFQILN